MSVTIPSWWRPASRVLWAATFLLLVGSLWLIARAPVEAQMGMVQKIVYVHVPSAIANSQ